MEYELIKQDTMKKLELGKIYIIEPYMNEFYQIVNASRTYILDEWQLKNMFKEVINE